MKKIKPWLKYVLLFCLLVVFLNFIPCDLDEIWNYGFMHNIYSGLIPYKDFNMVITPFFPFLFSLPFHIFGSNLLVVQLEQALLITLSYYLLEKLFGKNANILLLILVLNWDLIYVSYNYFVFFLLLVLLLMEKKKSNDYLIGIVIGLAILTKQSIGVCLALPSLYYLFSEPKKVGKRIVGALIPILIFIIYLFISNSYIEFFDLCVLGMFDFGKENYLGFSFVVILFIVCILLLIYLIIRNPKKLMNYYVLSFVSIAIPMLDAFHFKFFLFVMLFLIIDKIRIPKINLTLFTMGCIFGIVVSCVGVTLEDGFIYPNSVRHFEFKYMTKEQIKETQLVSRIFDTYKDRKVIFLVEQSYYYKLVNDLPINWFDLINTGNWGYHGSRKLYNALKEEKDAIFVINKASYVGSKQTDKVSLEFVKKYGKKIDQVLGYEIYEIK